MSSKKVAVAAAFLAGAAASGGGTIKLNWSDCGDSSTHGHITSLSPTSVTLGTKTSISGKGKVDEAIPGATYNVVAKEGFIPIFSHTGDACKPGTIKLPAGAGEIDMKGFKCPLSPGAAELDLDLTLSSSIPAKLARITIELTAESSSGDKALCVQIKTSPENLIADGENLIADTSARDKAAVAGAFTVGHKDVRVGGYVCGESQNARVYFPETTDKVPVISFAHGYANPGAQAYNGYHTMLEAIAAAGYVVIVSESASFPAECPTEWKDQVRSLAWIKTSDLADKIDYTKKTGVMGHSMGGGATHGVIASATLVKDYNIGAGFMHSPQIYGGGSAQVPAFYGTGSADFVIAPALVKAAYDKTVGVPKVFAEVSGATHQECKAGHANRLTPHNIAMFDCHLKGNKEQCAFIYGHAKGALCSGPVPMTSCKHANEPTADTVVV